MKLVYNIGLALFFIGGIFECIRLVFQEILSQVSSRFRKNSGLLMLGLFVVGWLLVLLPIVRKLQELSYVKTGVGISFFGLLIPGILVWCMGRRWLNSLKDKKERKVPLFVVFVFFLISFTIVTVILYNAL